MNALMFKVESTKLATLRLEARRRCIIQPVWINDAQISEHQQQ